jgi:hypothetical protein
VDQSDFKKWQRVKLDTSRIDKNHAVANSEFTKASEHDLRIKTCISFPDDQLEPYRPGDNFDGWELLISGWWGEDRFHGGYIAYFIANPAPGVWMLDGVQRNAELDGVTQEDVEEGRLNDDQLQAMWGISLEEAKNCIYQRIVAVCEKALPESSSKEMGTLLYDAVERDGGLIVSEPEGNGLIG